MLYNIGDSLEKALQRSRPMAFPAAQAGLQNPAAGPPKEPQLDCPV